MESCLCFTPMLTAKTYQDHHYSDNQTQYLDRFIIIGTSPANLTEYLEGWCVLYDYHVIAHSCALWTCLQAYNISVENGNQRQNIIANWSQIVTDNDWCNFTDIPDESNVHAGTNYGFSELSSPLINATVDFGGAAGCVRVYTSIPVSIYSRQLLIAKGYLMNETRIILEMMPIRMRLSFCAPSGRTD